MFKRRKIIDPGEGIIEPFRIAVKVYFVGTYQASAHLVDTGDGLILIDTGYENTADIGDVKYIINTHWHGDHTEATARIAGLSGAKTLIGREDFEKSKRYFVADILVSDGDKLKLGDTEIRFISTPGHTKGCISFVFDTVHDGRSYRVGMFGGAGANTLARGHFDYEGCREDYLKSLDRLRKETVDIFIGNHCWNNDTEAKGRILCQTGRNEFIDGKLFGEFLDYCQKRLESLIEKENNG